MTRSCTHSLTSIVTKRSPARAPRISSASPACRAARCSPAAIGSDTGGSVRIRAALCGLTGHKPTYGIVSLHGAVPLSTTLDSIGPLARTAHDAALLLAAMAGPDAHDATTQAVPS